MSEKLFEVYQSRRGKRAYTAFKYGDTPTAIRCRRDLWEFHRAIWAVDEKDAIDRYTRPFEVRMK